MKKRQSRKNGCKIIDEICGHREAPGLLGKTNGLTASQMRAYKRRLKQYQEARKLIVPSWDGAEMD